MGKVICDNCDWQGDVSDLLTLQDFFERHDTGGEELLLCGAGECPECNCLAYHEKGLAEWGRYRASADLLAELKWAVAFVPHCTRKTEARALVARVEAGSPTQRSPEQQADRATILAALRYYQEHGQGEPANRSDWIHNIATSCGDVISLDAAAIDDLCERINR